MYKLVGQRNHGARFVILWTPSSSAALAHSTYRDRSSRLIHDPRYLSTQLMCVGYDLHYATVNRIWTAPHV